jgi:hypothetical protein
LKVYWKKLSPGGIYCGHDYDGAGDRRKGFGVKRAVDKFALRHKYEVNTAPANIWWFKKRMEEKQV